ncbi:MAG: thiamine diphosphokinase [Christensenellaceae bacterium]|jgi:thiamine pyrophosphokinase|nr:thiamine diphosphokinase [Christensenellaceae bacterium]
MRRTHGKNTCYIFGAGEYFCAPIPPRAGDYIIAADGGYAHALRYGLAPHAVIGDFDSGPVPPHPNVIRLNPVKDETDTLSALNHGLALGYDTFFIYGGTGGRTAHTLANIQSLARLAERGARGFLFGNNEIFTTLCAGSLQFESQSGGYISVFALSDTCSNVCETGLKYELKGFTMARDYPIGVSNEFIGKQASISVEQGTLLVIFTPKASLKEDAYA